MAARARGISIPASGASPSTADSTTSPSPMEGVELEGVPTSGYLLSDDLNPVEMFFERAQ